MNYHQLNNHRMGDRLMSYQRRLIARSEVLWPVSIFLTLFLIMGRIWLQQRGPF
jgi:hypothetical protein